MKEVIKFSFAEIKNERESLTVLLRSQHCVATVFHVLALWRRTPETVFARHYFKPDFFEDIYSD